MIMCQVKPISEPSKTALILIVSSTAFLTTPAKEPGPKNPPVEEDFAQEASKQDWIAARCSAAMGTKELGLNTEPDCREPAKSIQKPAENHRSKDLWDKAYSRLSR
jgi:hypothetical protein